MTIAFKYRANKIRDEWTTVEPYSSLALEEGISYLVKFDYPENKELAKELAKLGCERLDDGLYSLKVINFAGNFSLCNVKISISPSKLDSKSFSSMLEEISITSATLLFGWNSPTSFKTIANTTTHNPPAYHQLQFLRRAMLGTQVGDRLQDYFAIIEHHPTSEFDKNRKPVPLDRVKHLDNRAIQRLVTHPDKMSVIEPTAPLYESSLAKSFTSGSGLVRHVPVEVWQPTKQLSFNTLENRFVKRVLLECTNLVNRFILNKQLHASMRDDCQRMLSMLTHMSESPFLYSVNPLENFNSPSQSLLKSEGYRDFFSFWSKMLQHRALPLDSSETVELLEGKNLALLYEYWVFICVIDEVARVMEQEHADDVLIRRDELGERLPNSICMKFDERVSVSFNKSYTRAQKNTYSTPLRPDIVLEIENDSYVFDAKYRMTKNIIDGEDSDKEFDGSYKRADLYKMHTYRDAIHNVKAAFAVYPGNETIFFDRNGHKVSSMDEVAAVEGVGVIALQPNQDRSDLRSIVSSLIHR